jgi:RNA polymerase sigma-70 factor (ECF subfamily)
MATEALRAAFLEHRPMLLRLLVARLGAREEAEDALQDMWLRIDGLDGAGIEQPASFLYRVAANLATDRRIAGSRRQVRDDAWSGVQPDGAEFPDAERQLIARDQLAHAQRTMAAMSDRMRTALVMFRVEEVPQRAIAEHLGITVSGVEKLLRRAYRLLHDSVRSADPSDGADAIAPHRLGGEGSTDRD